MFLKRNSNARRLPLICAAVLTLGAMLSACTTQLINEELIVDPAIVETDAGPVHGTVTDKYRQFLGLPYANPPVGELRWRSPQAVDPWSEPLDATQPAPACMQAAAEFPMDEDCLYLNVTTPPVSAPDDLKPVMVWLHGGGFTEGRANEFDPHRLAVQGDVVVVTVEFRLGIFGYLGHPDLPGSGTFGLQDQQAALRWVRANAEAFGGDPDNVTLFGHSGGAIATCLQLISPAAKGLFDKAILQSGACTTLLPTILPTAPTPRSTAATFLRPLPAMEEAGVDLVDTLDCAASDVSIDCLRELPAADLQAHVGRFYGPAYNTPILPTHPVTALQMGEFPTVPILTGHTRNESRLSTALFVYFNGMAAEDYTRLLNAAFGDNASAVNEQYPLSAYDSPALAWANLETDRTFVCPQIRAGRALAQHSPTYMYEFADPDAPPYIPAELIPTIFPDEIPPGASHASELGYLFDLAGKSIELTPAQEALSDQMIANWSRFTHTGDPNGTGLPDWPRYRPTDEPPYVQILAPGADGNTPVNAATAHQCDFWSDIDLR